MEDFRVRSREVRAASQQLMRELRQARAARSRHKPLTSTPVSSGPVAAVTPPARVSSILPSRKMLAAEAAPPDIVARAANVRQPKAATPSPVEQVVPEVEAAPPKPSRPKARKQPSAKPALAKPALAKPALAKPALAKPALAKPTLAKPEPVEPANPGIAAPERVEVAATQPEPAPSEPPIQKAPSSAKPARKSKVRTNVASIIADGLAPVAALQQAVTAALEAKPLTSNRAALPVSAVPSLGPGMVWRLNQLGLRTLADLAEADAEILRSKLGKLGRMVNVEQWIAYARAA